jgi:hypothetical protein
MPKVPVVMREYLVLRHIALDRSHLEKREQQLAEETSRRAVHFIGKKEQLVRELEGVEVSHFSWCTWPFGV